MMNAAKMMIQKFHMYCWVRVCHVHLSGMEFPTVRETTRFSLG